NVLFIGFVMLSGIPLLAQSSGIAANPIAGTWTGYLGPGTTPRFAITMELTVDGTGAVSGTLLGLPSPGEIRGGSFDAKTGALKLLASPTDDSVTRLTLEGIVVLGTVTGRVSGDNDTGTFKITKKNADAPASTGQSSGGNEAKFLTQGFGEVSGWISKVADLVPEDKYGYRPTATVRTIAQQIGHIADSYNYYCARAGGRPVQWSDAIEKGDSRKAALSQKLKQATDACNAAYAGDGQAAMLMANIAHSGLHYGNLITYLRMLGLKPPSS
ncbi:MAG: DinB family protein, partial [Acidobacteriota bacterium]